jgi:transcription antitermination factor NusA-like protein
MEKDWVKIYTSANYYRSEIVKQMLAEHQITSVLINKQDPAHRSFGDIEVYIHQEDFSKAIELIVLNPNE